MRKTLKPNGNTILSLSLPPAKIRELKIRAAIAGKTLSEFMAQSACEVDMSQITAGAKDLTLENLKK